MPSGPICSTGLASEQKHDVIAMPLLNDYSTVNRFLIVAPALLLADSFTKPLLQRVTNNFIKQKLIAEANIAEYSQFVQKLTKVRESIVLELIILLIAAIS
ncbi:hypothetical protein BH11CYA1_BH11CYA1_46560 [soil metagenome]